MIEAGHTQFIPTDAKAISGDTDLTLSFTGQPYARGIYVGVAGDVEVKFVGDTTAVTYKNVPAGSSIWGIFSNLVASLTTATSLLALK